MPYVFKGSVRKAGRRVIAMVLLAMAGGSGCQWFRQDLPHAPLVPGPTASKSSVDYAEPVAAVSGPAAVQVRKALAEPIWTHTLPSRDDDPLEVHYRWQHHGLESVLLRPAAAARDDLFRLIRDADTVVAGNAAIGLARLGNAAGMERLVAVVRDTDRALPMRCAAVEALAALGGPPPLAMLRDLLDEYGNFEPRRRSFYVADLHGELIRGLARHVGVADDPRFAAALRSPSADVRLATVEVWTVTRPGDLPAALADLRADNDPRVRAATMAVLGRCRHEQSQMWLAAGTADHDLVVRVAAIAALGQLGGVEAQTVLDRLRENQPEFIRASAVSALAQLGARQQVAEGLKDKSWLVRAAVADAVGGYPDRDGAAMAQRLLEDPSAEVQRRVLVAIGRWPLELSGPVLLRGLDRPAYTTRKLALDQLTARWRPAREFSLEAPPGRRQQALERLQQRFRQEFGLPNRPAAGTVAAGERRPVAAITPERVDEVERLVRRVGDMARPSAEREQAAQSLAGFGGDLVPALEQLLLTRQVPLPEPVYREVLPKCGAPFEALERLAADDVSERRRAADSLVVTAAQRPLGRLGAARLASLVVRQQDTLVWLAALTALESDPSESAMGLAYAGLSHPESEVRRRACLNLAAHPDPRHERALVPVLDDTSEPVVLAAVQAIGQLGRMSDATPLKKMIAVPNETVRVEVAGALARWGDPQGCEALERQAYSSDFTVRHRAAVLMGEAADARFVPTLMQMLGDSRMNVRQAALESLPKTASQNPARSDTATALDSNEQIRRWKAWYEKGGRKE